MKKLGRLAMFAGIIGVIMLGWNTLQGFVAGEEKPPVTITTQTTQSAIPIFESLKNDISALKASDEALQSKIDQMIHLLQMIEAEVAALSK
jgi:hypothetical protein